MLRHRLREAEIHPGVARPRIDSLEDPAHPGVLGVGRRDDDGGGVRRRVERGAQHRRVAVPGQRGKSEEGIDMDGLEPVVADLQAEMCSALEDTRRDRRGR